MTINLPPWLGKILGASIEIGPLCILAEQDPRTLRHEAVHRAEQAAIGWGVWCWRWLAHRSFRLQAEARAWAAEEDPGGKEDFAQALCSWRYLWAARSLTEALLVLDNPRS